LANQPDLGVSYRPLDKLGLVDLEAIRLILRGDSVVDWQRLSFNHLDEAVEFLSVQEFYADNSGDQARIEEIKKEAIRYLRLNFAFPVPRAVSSLAMADLLMLASTKGHRQLCACTILKVMHIIHHLDAHELLFMLPISNHELCFLVEEKVYRVIGAMLTRNFPILEFIGGRKHKDSLYTKLLSKPEVTATNIDDRLRFRIVTRTSDDILITLSYLIRYLFPFNYVIPGQSTNTMYHFRSYCEKHSDLRELLPKLQPIGDIDDGYVRLENRFSASNYRVVKFVVNMPVRLPDNLLEQAPSEARHLGAVVFAQTEFQILDRETEQQNEYGEASHRAYKERQKEAVIRRLKVGSPIKKRLAQKD
jgi:uncharacterized protein (TIGR04552 family)